MKAPYIKHLRRACLGLLLIQPLACSRSERAPAPVAEDGAPEVESYALQPYPLGRWRLAAPSELETALIWVSHIQIRHNAVPSAEAAFSWMPWYPNEAAPARTKAQAFGLAERVAIEAQQDPARFAELARRFSEDVSSRDRGGMLGGLTAFQLSFPPEVLDAFASLRPGEVSRVLESEGGFHIFLRHSVPPAERVSGARIVIGYEGADGLKIVGGGPANRSRAAALELTQSVYRKAVANPDGFAALVAEYSEHPDLERQGDFGAWSSREPSTMQREIAVLRELGLGEIAPPLDSPVGFEIIRRTPERARPGYAMDAIVLRFDPRLSDPDPLSQAFTERLARELIEQLSLGAANFAALQAQYCCAGSRQWLAGQDEQGNLTRLVSSLEYGQVAREPAEDHWSYVIPKRRDPATLPIRPARLDVPSPERIDMIDLVRRSAGSDGFMKGHLDAIASEVAPALGLDVSELASLSELAQELDLAPAPEERIEHYQRLLLHLRERLDAASYGRYEHALYNHFEALYLHLTSR